MLLYYFNIFYIVLAIEGEASVLVYQEILRNVTFFIDSLEPDSSNRTICFTIFDGIHGSTPACVVLRVILLNDNPPSIVNATGLGEAYVEGSGGVGLLENLNITDDDDPTLFYMERARVRPSHAACLYILLCYKDSEFIRPPIIFFGINFRSMY